MSDQDIISPLDEPFFNLFNQTFPLYDSDGVEFDNSLADVAAYVRNGVQQCIVDASQIGAAATVLVILIMLTKSEKRRLPVYILNSLALLFTVIDQVLICVYYTGPWYTPYAYLSGDYTFVPQNAKATSCAAEILAFFVQLFLETSLVLQVHVVTVTLDRARRAAITLVSIAVALVAIAFRLAQTIENIRVNIVMEQQNYNVANLARARDITLTFSICFFSAIFCLKLGWAMHQRRKLGLTRFGPMQVIFIGGTQTLIIPVIVSILQFAKPSLRASSLILTVTAISLPVTSLWATASAENPSTAARGPDAHRKFLMSDSSGSKQSKRPFGKTDASEMSDMQTPLHDRFHEPRAAEKDLEMQELGPVQ